MGSASGNVAPAKSVLAEINERLAVLKQEEYCLPHLEPEKGYHPVGMMNEYLKQLFTVRTKIRSEIDQINRKGEDIAKRMLNVIGTRESLKSIADALSVVSQEELESLDRLKVESKMKMGLHSLINDLFWLEVRRLHPAIAHKPAVGVRKDLSVGWMEREEADDLDGLLLAGLLGGRLEELLGEDKGRRHK